MKKSNLRYLTYKLLCAHECSNLTLKVDANSSQTLNTVAQDSVYAAVIYSVAYEGSPSVLLALSRLLIATDWESSSLNTFLWRRIPHTTCTPPSSRITLPKPNNLYSCLHLLFPYALKHITGDAPFLFLSSFIPEPVKLTKVLVFLSLTQNTRSKH